MGKVIRNTVFTAVAVAATALGVGWNKQIAKQYDPVAISENVLTAPATKAKIAEFPLTVEFSREFVKLGQYQEMVVRTEPFAELEIVTVYPNGSINNPQTLRTTASETGEYRLKYKLDDFHHLGVFQVLVQAKVGERAAEANGRFALQTWIQENLSLGNSYIYPIVP